MAAATVATLCCGARAGAQVHPMPYANQPFPPGDYSKSQFTDHDRVHIQTRLKELREEAIATQKADGGVLTPEHRAAFQQRVAVLRKQACAVGLGGKDCPRP